MSSGKSNQCLSKGNKEFKSENYTEALKDYTEGLEVFNFSNLSQLSKNELYKSTNKFVICALLNKRSECYLKLKENENGLKDLLQIEIAKPQAKLLFQIGEIYFEEKKHQKALNYYNKAKKLNQIYLLGKEGEKIKLCETKAMEELKFIPMKEDQLVEEILFQIFIFLNEFDLKKLSRTCSQFKNLSENQELWKLFLKKKDEKYFNLINQKKDKKINWKNLYHQNYLFSDLYFVNVYSINNLPTKYLPLEGRGIQSIQNQFLFSIKNQVFEIIDFTNKSNSKLLKFESQLNFEFENNFNLGNIIQIDSNQNSSVVLFDSNIFYFTNNQDCLWSFDRKHSNFVTSLHEEKIKKISNGIVLTKSGDAYLNESIKFAENIHDIYTLNKERIGLIHKNNKTVSIHKYPKINNFSSLPVLFKFDYDIQINQIEIQSSFIALLSDTGRVFISNEYFLSTLKKRREIEGSISNEPSFYEIDTSSIGFIKNIRSIQNALLLHTINGDVFISGSGYIGLGNEPNRVNVRISSTNGEFKQIKFPSSHPVIDISYCWYLNQQTLLFLVSNPKSNYLMMDIPDEILKCKFCGEDYRKDDNLPTSCLNVNYSEKSDSATTQYHHSI
eukprot:gene2909-4752_t